MNKRTLKALQGSIKKWEGIVSGTTEDHGRDNCPLCHLFNPRENVGYNPNACDGCPVKEKTGMKYCEGTPYSDFDNSWFSEEQEKSMLLGNWNS